MKFDFCFPRELERIKKENIPVVIAGGTVEYHGPHCSYGCDTLVAQGLIEKLSEQKGNMYCAVCLLQSGKLRRGR